MIFPEIAAWPPKIFTPKRLLFESRPFFTLPSPFLCAMIFVLKFQESIQVPILQFASCYLEFNLRNFVDPDFCVVSAVTEFFSETFSAFLFIRNYFITFYVVKNFCLDLYTALLNFKLPLSSAKITSENSSLSPALPPTFGTYNVWSFSTLNCLPAILITANITVQKLGGQR